MLVLATGCMAVFAWADPVWPVPGGIPASFDDVSEIVQPTASGEVESALFGCVRTNGRRFHEGIDLAPMLPRKRGEATDPVTALHDGIVRHISNVSGNSSYGRYVVLEHTGLDLVIYSLYSHLASVDSSLAVGQAVRAGSVLGIMGRSAGGYTIPRERAHLHLEIGLRLSDRFGDWYRQQSFETPNKHGNFNGMNLTGWDPMDYFRSYASGEVSSPLDYISSIPPAVMLHVRTRRIPDFVNRYPELVLDGCEPADQEGWEVILSGWGLPVSIKPLSGGSLRGVPGEGDISVIGMDRQELDTYGCRRLVSERSGKVTLGTEGKRVLELLFMPSPGAS